MSNSQTRREMLKLLGIGSAVFASSLVACAGQRGAPPTNVVPERKRRAASEDFMFLQLSDTHWGFSGPPNPESDVTLPKAVELVNGLSVQPDFIMFTGDLTHRTDDPAERAKRMTEFKSVVSSLKVKNLKFIPGEHDASADGGAAFREHFGATYYSFDHNGLHFIALDNASDPAAGLGTDQLNWLGADLRTVPKEVPIVVFAHRPLFDLYPAWDWATRDGDRAVALLGQHPNVTVFYGHIHQLHQHMTGRIAHHSAQSLIFALPAPGSVPKRAPIAWDPTRPGAGLGYRDVRSDAATESYDIVEVSMERKA